MSFHVACVRCGHLLSVKDEWEGKRLKCPKCSAIFSAVRNVAAAAESAEARDTESSAPGAAKFNLPFTLGGDDRYPRPLFWGLLVYLLIDIAVALPLFLAVLKEDAKLDYHAERLIGWALAVLVPPGVAMAVIATVSMSAPVYAVYKLLLIGVVLSSALGASMIGESARGGSVAFHVLWHVLGLVLGVWYFLMRREG